MKSVHIVALVMLAIWAALIAALQLSIAHRVLPFGGPVTWFLPDWGLVLLVALSVKLPRQHVWKATVVLAIVRMAYSNDPPVGILAGYGWVSFLVLALRSGVDVSGVLPRTLIAFAGALGWAVWGQVVHWARHAPTRIQAISQSEWWEMAQNALPGALVTAAMVGLLGAVLCRLPGLSTLYQRPRFG